METRTGRTPTLYFIPPVAIMLGLTFLPLANAVTNSFFDWFFGIGGLILLFVVGIGGGLLALGLYLWHTRAANIPR